MYSRLRVLYLLLLAAGGILERPCLDAADKEWVFVEKPSIFALGKVPGIGSMLAGDSCMGEGSSSVCLEASNSPGVLGVMGLLRISVADMR